MRRSRQGVGRRTLLVSLLVLVVALELASTCHGQYYSPIDSKPRPLSDFFVNPPLRIDLIKIFNEGKNWVKKASDRVVNTLKGKFSQFLDSAPKFRRFYNFIKFAVKQRFSFRNPWLRCAKVGWQECLARNSGFNKATIFICPLFVYYECQKVYHLGRIPYYAPDPYFDSFIRPPPRRLLWK